MDKFISMWKVREIADKVYVDPSKATIAKSLIHFYMAEFGSHLFIYRTNVVMNYTEVEGKVREATNGTIFRALIELLTLKFYSEEALLILKFDSDEAWGPTGPLLQELAHGTFTYEHFPGLSSVEFSVIFPNFN